MPRMIVKLAMMASMAAAAAMLGGCATYDENLVDAGGRERRCEMTGWGGIGMRQAREGVTVCRETFNALGFIDRDRVGDLGIGAIRPAGGYLSIEQVEPASPAARHGIEPGDALLSVNGRRVHHVIDARRGLFGRAGDSARVEVMQGDLTRIVVLERETAQQIAAHGQPQAVGVDGSVGPVGTDGQPQGATSTGGATSTVGSTSGQPAEAASGATPAPGQPPASSAPLVIPGDPAASRP